MSSFKQALNQLKITWAHSLLFGFVAMSFIYLAQVTPWFGAYVVSLVLLLFQEMSRILLVERRSLRHFTLEGKDLLSYLLVALVMLPTSVLYGSALGLLDSPQDFFVKIPLSFLLLIVSSYFFLVLSQALRWHLESRQNLGRAIDTLGLESFKHFRPYLAMSFYIGVLILVSGMTKGVGLIVALPLVFLLNHYLYLQMKDSFTARAQQ